MSEATSCWVLFNSVGTDFGSTVKGLTGWIVPHKQCQEKADC